MLIPCFNESKTIKKVVEDYKRILPEATIYVYDNNSSDGTDNRDICLAPHNTDRLNP